MKNRRLSDILVELGFSKTDIQNLYVYYLSTAERKENMLSWIDQNREGCTREAVFETAKTLLNQHLNTFPYNKVDLSKPLPVYRPPVPPPPQPEPVEPTVTVEPPMPIFEEENDEDPVDRLIRILWGK